MTPKLLLNVPVKNINLQTANSKSISLIRSGVSTCSLVVAQLDSADEKRFHPQISSRLCPYSIKFGSGPRRIYSILSFPKVKTRGLWSRRARLPGKDSRGLRYSETKTRFARQRVSLGLILAAWI